MRIIVVLVALLTSLSSAASAATYLPYTQSRFAKAQAQGRRILVNVNASWCATCSLQAPTAARQSGWESRDNQDENAPLLG
jgi:thiol:disulfide interchange protein